jgi:hypothetical protein
MGMLRSYLKLLLLLHRDRRFRGSVCVLGNQEIWADYDRLRTCFTEVGVPYRTPKEIRPHSSRMFKEDPILDRLAERFVHASVFFDMMGMDEYVDVDKFATDRPVLQLDLNLPVSDALHERFDLMIDGGTVEHIFDVRAVMQNVCSMTRIGGHVVHMATFQPDHGFYAFSPTLFYEFYLANGFADPECYLLYVDYQDILRTYADPHPYLRYEYGKTVLPQGSEIPFMVLFAARKTRTMMQIEIPTQGVFARGNAGLNERPAPPAASMFERLVPRPLQAPLQPIRLLARPLVRLTGRLRRHRQTVNTLPRI